MNFDSSKMQLSWFKSAIFVICGAIIQAVTFPMRFWMEWKVREFLRESRDDGYDIQAVVGLRYFVIMDQLGAPKSLYMGHWMGGCSIPEHLHVSGPSCILFQAMWWNFRHRRPVFNFIRDNYQASLSGLMADIDRCGKPREAKVRHNKQVLA